MAINKDNDAAEKRASKKPFFGSLKHPAVRDEDVNQAIKITSLILISVLSLFVFVKIINEVKAYTTIGEAPLTPYTISVSGFGEVNAPKDTTTLSFTAYGKGTTASAAQEQAAQSGNAAIAFVTSKGIAQADISTESYNTNPIYDQKVKPCVVDTSSVRAASTRVGAVDAVSPAMEPAISVAPIAPCNTYESVITGYETTQTVRIKIRDIVSNPSLSGEIITGLGTTGVRVGGLVNEIDDIENLKNEARQIAISKAREQAYVIAQSLGARLGKVVSYYENSPVAYPMYSEMSARGGAMMDAKMTPSLPAGDGKVTSDVSVTFEIK